MCGICGELKFDDGQPELQAVSRMMDKLARRGSDHGGSFSDGALAFGHRRLAVMTLQEQDALWDQAKADEKNPQGNAD